MFTAVHEWSRPNSPAAQTSSRCDLSAAPAHEGALAGLYQRLLAPAPDETSLALARDFLRDRLLEARDRESELPEAPQDLMSWMECNAQLVTAKYTAYLEERKAGAPRRYFANRAHALYFLRAVAPTKLVDGAWLYGLAGQWHNPRFSHLVRTYVEELGEGRPDKNHVLLYRRLMATLGLDTAAPMEDAFHEQGLIQLALGWNAQEFLPEVIGFNLGYEQLPLHLLVTAHELNELGIDPYYFTLHVTVDNCDSGHARQACQAVMDTLPQLADADAFWQRVRNGSRLGCMGLGTTAVIEGFDIEREARRIFMHKSQAGHGAHSDYCRIGGRHVNEWLSQPDQVPAFVEALQQAGWIRRGEPVEQSRFWKLLQGERAEMFGVFTAYELQVIRDWIEDGAVQHRQATFRATARAMAPAGCGADAQATDLDVQALTDSLATQPQPARMELLVRAMSPALHWTPMGLHATRLFCATAQ